MIGYSLPTAIEIDGKSYPVTQNGHFEMVLDCFKDLNDEEIPQKLRVVDCCKIFYEDINDDSDIMLFGDHFDEAVKKMYSFFNCNQVELPQKNTSTSIKLVDWETDAQLICAAILEKAGKDIRSLPYLHWFTFMGYYMSIDPNSAWGNIISIRYKRARGKTLEKYEREYVDNNPQYFKTAKQIEEENSFDRWLEEQEKKIS